MFLSPTRFLEQEMFLYPDGLSTSRCGVLMDADGGTELCHWGVAIISFASRFMLLKGG